MASDTKTPYSPLSEDDNDVTVRLLTEEHDELRSQHLRGPTRATSPTWIVVLLAVLATSFALSTILFAGLWLQAKSTFDSIANPQLLYSPAAEAIEYEVVKFHSGPLNNEGDDIYSLPPSPEVDAAWRDLYEVGTIGLTESEASHLVNKTAMNGDKYIVGVDVFHQLHCLNKIRKALYPEYYSANDTEPSVIHDIHLSHCLNSIRQSLQCSSDISTVVFQQQSIERIHSDPKILPSFNVLHSCRSFHKIKDWVKDRWAGDYLDEE